MPPRHSVVVYGDSFSAGSGENLADPALWPNKLERLLDTRGSEWSVSNRSINGNGLVWETRCFGQPALDRFAADQESLPRETTIVLMAGINDAIQPTLPVGFSDCFDPADFTARDITARLDQLRRSRDGRRILIATIPPLASSEFYSPKAEAVRQEANRWIRANWREADLIDLEQILGEPGDPSRLRPDYDSGDGLHPNERGAMAIATAVAKSIR